MRKNKGESTSLYSNTTTVLEITQPMDMANRSGEGHLDPTLPDFLCLCQRRLVDLEIVVVDGPTGGWRVPLKPLGRTDGSG